MNTGETPAKRDVASFASLGTRNTPTSIGFGALFRSMDHSHRSHGADEVARINENARIGLELVAKEHPEVTAFLAHQQMERCRLLNMKSTVVRPVRTGEDDLLGYLDNPADVQAWADIWKQSREASKEDGERVASDAADGIMSRWRGRAETIQWSPAAEWRPTEVIPATPPATRDDMDELLRQAAVTARKSRAKNTQQSYSSSLRMFAKFAAKHGQTAFPADARTVAAFLQSKMNAGAAPGSLNVDLSAIRSVHRAGRKPDPTADPNVRAVLRGYRRIWAAQGKSSKQAKGLSESDLAAIIAVADMSDDIHAIRDVAIVSLLREGLLRRGECTALRVGNFWREKDGSGRIWIAR